MCFLLQAIQTRHQHHSREEQSQRHHEAQEHFIVQIVCCEGRGYGHLVGHIVINLVWHCLGDFLQPASVVEDYENIIVHLILGEEHRVGRAPLADLLLIRIGAGRNKVTCDHLFMFKPDS